ncbi:MAG: glycoside hydrolase family 3 N-terminal domain-containing protein [Chthoniobacterales bacterium]
MIGQTLLVGVPGKTLDSDTAALLRRIQPGGFIIFSRNIESPTQLRQLLDDLRAISDVEPIITIDQEGGRVSRLREIGHEPPNAQQLRQKGDLDLITWHGRLTGHLLRLFGFNLDLCPVLDISFDDEADNSVKGRCYGTNVAQVIQLAGAFNDALRGTGILSCGKHFPGYTSAGLDPHHELPAISRSKELMEEHELAVFRYFADKVDSMMTGHIAIDGLDTSGLPASLSPAITTDLLKKDVKFAGLTMTDDLDMGAILNHYGLPDTLRMALEAGNDLLMICHRVEMIAEAYDIVKALPASAVDPALENIAKFKRHLAPPDAFSIAAHTELDGEVRKLRAATLGEAEADRHSPEDGKRSPVELY